MGGVNLSSVVIPERKSSTLIPSPQQERIFKSVTDKEGSLIIEAVAGAGKTTTLIEAVSRMKGSVAFTAFNKRIVTEIESKLNGIGINTRAGNVSVGTFHSFGLKTLKGSIPKLEVEGDKLETIINDLGVNARFANMVEKLVGLAKQYGVDVNDRDSIYDAAPGLIDHFDLTTLMLGKITDAAVEEAVDIAARVLEESVTRNDIVDFDDMIYMPLLLNLQFRKYDWVLVDEAQDTNPTRRMMAGEMLQEGGRLVAVGDPHQAIYGFTGANADSLDLIQEQFKCTRLPLTVTYRCPTSVVDLARTWVSHITAHESAEVGEVSELKESSFLDCILDEDNPQEVAVLCRNTKPLIKIAYSLIKRGMPCHVEGRDIGMGLLYLAKHWKDESLKNLKLGLVEWENEQVKLWKARNKPVKAAAAQDKVESLFAIMEMLPPNAIFKDLEAQIFSLFGDTPDGRKSKGITLSTIHKAKGREWDIVYLYQRDSLMPSPYASKAWELEQEYNLCYVAVTRARRVLIEVTSPPRTLEALGDDFSYVHIPQDDFSSDEVGVVKG